MTSHDILNSSGTFSSFHRQNTVAMFVGIVTAVVVSSLSFLIVSKFCSSRKRVQNINEKFVLITGCDSGFGRQAAILFNSLGFQVFVTCLTKEGEEDLKSVCNNEVRTLRLDVTKHEAIEQAYSEVLGTLPSNTGKLIVCTGFLVTKPLSKLGLRVRGLTKLPGQN